MPTMPRAGRRKVFEARLPASVWPSRALKVTAVDARTGELAADLAGGGNHGAGEALDAGQVQPARQATAPRTRPG